MSDHLDILRSLRQQEETERSSLNQAKQTTTVIEKNLDNRNVQSRLSIRLDRINQNAYRILGLSAKATQKEIQTAASSLKRSIKLETDYVTPWDLVWLGPLKRDEAHIQDALGRLANPELRLREKLFWFTQDSDHILQFSPVKASEDFLNQFAQFP